MLRIMDFNNIRLSAPIYLFITAIIFLTYSNAIKSMELENKGKRKATEIENPVIAEQEKKQKVEESIIESPGPIFLNVHNNTNHDFQLTEVGNFNNRTLLAMLPRQATMEYHSMPLYNSVGYWSKHTSFLFKVDGRLVFIVTLFLRVEDENTTVVLQRNFGEPIIQRQISTDPANQFFISVTINGTAADNFSGTTLQLSTGVQKA